MWDSAWIAGADYNNYDDDQDYDDEDVKLPGVNIDKEEEEQIWEDLDESKVTNLLGKVNPIHPELHQEDHDAQQEYGVRQQVAAIVEVETIDEEEEDDEIKTRAGATQKVYKTDHTTHAYEHWT